MCTYALPKLEGTDTQKLSSARVLAARAGAGGSGW